VLAEYGPTGVLAMDACRRAGIPLVVHFHGYDASERAVLAAHSETYPIMFREAAAIIAVSRAMQRKLVSLGALPEKVHYNPCGIDCEVFEASDPAAAPPVFLAVGRFVEKKGPQLTLKAFAEVYEAYPSARLRMIGDGPLLEECRALVLKLRINEAVTFTGAQPHTVVRREMQSARCFVQHSLEAPNGDCEGTPVGILEACASALPVVSTRHAGIPDVIVEGETGLLVDERDTKGMAEQMLSLARDAELARRLGLAARQHVAAHFSQAQSLDRLWTIISSAIGAGTRTEVEASTVAVT
jgi:colanic acid/amylovoran biosynthesis glycosyltransferase